jgi:hypothetical protein
MFNSILIKKSIQLLSITILVGMSYVLISSTQIALADTQDDILTEVKTIRTHTTIIADIKACLDKITDAVQKIYDLINEPFSDESAKENTEIATRYVAYSQIEDTVKPITDSIVKKMNNLIQYGQYNADSVDKDANFIKKNYESAMKRTEPYKDQIPDQSTSASTLLSKTMINDDAQKKAAEDFIINAVGNIPLPREKFPSDSDDQKKYIAYQRMASSIQSFATQSFIEDYTSRLPFTIIIDKINPGANITTSKKDLLRLINTGKSTDADYWLSGTGKAGIIPRVMTYLSSFFSINYSLNHIIDQLDKTNMLLSLITTQNTLITKTAYGDVLYEKIARGEKNKEGFSRD